MLTPRRIILQSPYDAPAKMSEPRVEMPGLVLQAAVELCPSGLLGKLAFVSKAFRAACKKESEYRARAEGTPLPPISVGLLTTAAEVEWALDCGCPVSAGLSTVTEVLAKGGSVPALEKAIQRGAPLSPLGLYSIAAGAGKLNVLIWLKNNGIPICPLTCSMAAKGGYMDVLQWAKANGARWDLPHTCSAAAGGGHLEVLKWARENGAPWEVDTCANAAGVGHLEVLKWARENGAPWCEITCANAAGGGHLEVLKWAREHGCPWDDMVCLTAARGGHLEVLKWARENGAPWHNSACDHAAMAGHLDVLKWAKDNGAPWSVTTRQILHRKGLDEAASWF